MKEIKWFKTSSKLEPKQAFEDDQKARLIAKKEDCIVRLIWDDKIVMVSDISDINKKHSISKSVTRYKEIEYINGDFEIREGTL